jgi:hypothetical protein
VRRPSKGLDPATWCNWEPDEIILFCKHRLAVAVLLALDEQDVASEIRARWNAKHLRT